MQVEDEDSDLEPGIIDHRGDLILVAKPCDVAFRVSSDALSRASPIWEHALHSKVMKTEDESEMRPQDVLIGADSSASGSRTMSKAALRIILNDVHGIPQSIKEGLNRDTLLDMAIMCDKYHMLRQFHDKWEELTTWTKCGPSPEHELTRLRLSWTLGLEHEFMVAVRDLASCMRGPEYEGRNLYNDESIQAMGIFGKYLQFPAGKTVSLTCDVQIA